MQLAEPKNYDEEELETPGYLEWKDNQDYLRNAALIQKMDRMKYRLSEVEGEIAALKRRRKGVVMTFICTTMLLIASVLFCMWFMKFSGGYAVVSYVVFAIWILLVLLKFIPSLFRMILRLPFVRNYIEDNGKETLETILAKKEVERKCLSGELKDLELHLTPKPKAKYTLS